MSDEWERGYAAGWRAALISQPAIMGTTPAERFALVEHAQSQPKRKRKLSDWQKYVKVNSKKPRFKYKSGSKKGRVNFKALGVAFRKTPDGKKKRR